MPLDGLDSSLCPQEAEAQRRKEEEELAPKKPQLTPAAGRGDMTGVFSEMIGHYFGGIQKKPRTDGMTSFMLMFP